MTYVLLLIVSSFDKRMLSAVRVRDPLLVQNKKKHVKNVCYTCCVLDIIYNRYCIVKVSVILYIFKLFCLWQGIFILYFAWNK